MGVRYDAIKMLARSTILVPYKKRKEYLGIVRQKVEEYTPKISELSGVPLKVPSVHGDPRFPGIFRDYAMCYARLGLNTILVPLNINNTEYLFKRGGVDSCVVHELSHHLWEHTPGKVNSIGKLSAIWSEGFAEFLTTNFFADLIPKCKPNQHSPGKVYNEGFKRGVFIACMDDSPRAVWDIPKNWKSLEAEYQKHLPFGPEPEMKSYLETIWQTGAGEVLQSIKERGLVKTLRALQVHKERSAATFPLSFEQEVSLLDAQELEPRFYAELIKQGFKPQNRARTPGFCNTIYKEGVEICASACPYGLSVSIALPESNRGDEVFLEHECAGRTYYGLSNGSIIAKRRSDLEKVIAQTLDAANHGSRLLQSAAS